MGNLLVLAGATSSGWASAYVVLSAGAATRIFKVSGRTDAPQIDELPAATTLDLKRFQEELKQDLYGMGPSRAMNAAEKEAVCAIVRGHLDRAGGS